MVLGRFDVANLYPERLAGSASPVFDPLAAYTNAPRTCRTPTPATGASPSSGRSRTSWSSWATRRAGAATGSTGPDEPVPPHRGAGGARGRDPQRRRDPGRGGAKALPAVREPTADPGLRGAGQERRRGPRGVRRGDHVGQQALLEGLAGRSRVHVQPLPEQQRRVPRRERDRRLEPAPAERSSTTRRSGAARSSTGRTDSPSAGSGRSPGRGPACSARSSAAGRSPG